MIKTFVLILLFATSAYGQSLVQNTDDVDIESTNNDITDREFDVFCSRTIRFRFSVGVTDERICASRGKVAPCDLRCGWFVIKNNCTELVLKGCKEIGALFNKEITATPKPTSTLRITPRPTGTLFDPSNPCRNKNPNYCWQKGAGVNPDGSCFSNCQCIPKTNPFLCAK